MQSNGFGFCILLSRDEAFWKDDRKESCRGVKETENTRACLSTKQQQFSHSLSLIAPTFIYHFLTSLHNPHCQYITRNTSSSNPMNQFLWKVWILKSSWGLFLTHRIENSKHLMFCSVTGVEQNSWHLLITTFWSIMLHAFQSCMFGFMYIHPLYQCNMINYHYYYVLYHSLFMLLSLRVLFCCCFKTKEHEKIQPWYFPGCQKAPGVN